MRRKTDFTLHLDGGGTLSFRTEATHPSPTPIAELTERIAKWIERNEQQRLEALRQALERSPDARWVQIGSWPG
jgi:hypothetical protein